MSPERAREARLIREELAREDRPLGLTEWQWQRRRAAELIDEEMVWLYCKHLENLAPGSQVWLEPPGESPCRIR
jgi:hypothetical protein